MFKALVIFFITVFLLTILLRFLRKVIGFFGGNIYTSRGDYNTSTGKNANQQEQASIQKRFSKNEGEYVDYEEIDDDDSSSK